MLSKLLKVTEKTYSVVHTKLCTAASIFDPKKTCSYLEFSDLVLLYPTLALSDLQDEWKTFCNYLKVQAKRNDSPSGKAILAVHNDLADIFCQVSQVESPKAETFA